MTFWAGKITSFFSPCDSKNLMIFHLPKLHFTLWFKKSYDSFSLKSHKLIFICGSGNLTISLLMISFISSFILLCDSRSLVILSAWKVISLFLPCDSRSLKILSAWKVISFCLICDSENLMISLLMISFVSSFILPCDSRSLAIL